MTPHPPSRRLTTRTFGRLALAIGPLFLADPAVAQASDPKSLPAPRSEVSAAAWDSTDAEQPEPLFVPSEDNTPKAETLSKRASAKPVLNGPSVPLPSRRLNRPPAHETAPPITPSTAVDLQILEKELRFERIRNQIRDLLDAQRRSPTPSAASSGPMPDGPTRSQGSESPQPTQLQAGPSPTLPGAAGPAELPRELTDGGSAPQEAAPSHQQSGPATARPRGPAAGPHGGEAQSCAALQNESPLAAPTVVPLDEPIDRLGLADTLYAAGELALARDAYSQVDRSQLAPGDGYWIDYQLAACYRRLGERDKAAEMLRRLAGDSAAGWLAELSRWWLDRIHERATLQAEGDRFAQLLKDLTAQIDGTKYD